MNLVVEFFLFLKSRKRLWLWPLFIFMVLLGLLLYLAQGSTLGSLLYSLF
ncbi:MAG: DUF5989 family protein [Mucilaginibacter sp.]